ncbi:uncharacterized protein cubi_01169 [Cryptosporidium ubiquitum]|uniref:Uncharacterized protein n=1 Tax=Cryptosporidium ubiquitum TaxID=857276 RepID=A0A1J4MN71_9CRYT|nr:uncharacterized protein cubi_01169 [Cryptosporidium ubiquitum]OII74325.1 hypothetical protein cubi_01169 [Cryptosporidium ubiquitum]
MNINMELVRELKLENIPIDLILDATCNSPPGIKNKLGSRRNDDNLDEDLVNPKLRILAEGEVSSSYNYKNQVEFSINNNNDQNHSTLENISEVSNLKENKGIFGSRVNSDPLINNHETNSSIYSEIKKTKTNYESRKKRNIPKFHLPIKSLNNMIDEEVILKEDKSLDNIDFINNMNYSLKYDFPNNNKILNNNSENYQISEREVNISKNDFDFDHLPIHSNNLSNYLNNHYSNKDENQFNKDNIFQERLLKSSTPSETANNGNISQKNSNNQSDSAFEHYKSHYGTITSKDKYLKHESMSNSSISSRSDFELNQRITSVSETNSKFGTEHCQESIYDSKNELYQDKKNSELVPETNLASVVNGPKVYQEEKEKEDFKKENNLSNHLNKLIPVSLLKQENNEIKLKEISNKERYSQIFKGEEFTDIFNKCWNDAGKELGKRYEDDLYQNKIEDLDKDSHLNHVPFQSDLIMINSKRKIKTTIPTKALNTNKVFNLNSDTDMINPMGLLRYVKEHNQKDEELFTNMRSIKQQIDDRGENILIEDMSTRASTMNNLASFEYNNNVTRNNTRSNIVISSELVSSSNNSNGSLEVYNGNMGSNLSYQFKERGRSNQEDLETYMDSDYTKSRISINKRSRSIKDDHSLQERRIFESKTDKITDLDQISNQDFDVNLDLESGNKYEHYIQEFKNSNVNNSDNNKNDNKSGFEDFFKIEKKSRDEHKDKKVVRLYKNDQQLSIQKLRDNLKSIETRRFGNISNNLLSEENIHKTIYEEFKDVRNKFPKKEFIVEMVDENKYDYGFSLEVNQTEKVTDVEMKIKEFHAPLISSLDFNGREENSSRNHLIDIPNSRFEEIENDIEVEDVQKDERNTQGKQESEQENEQESEQNEQENEQENEHEKKENESENDLNSEYERTSSENRGHFSTSTRYYNSLGLTEDFMLVFKNFSLARILSSFFGFKVKGVMNTGLVEKMKVEEENKNRQRNWKETIMSYEKLGVIVEKRNLILIFVISANIILISLANIIIPIVYSIKNALFPILTVNAIINFLIFYLINGTLIYVFTNKIKKFNNSILNDYFLLLQRINQIRKERRKLEYEEEQDEDEDEEDEYEKDEEEKRDKQEEEELLVVVEDEKELVEEEVEEDIMEHIYTQLMYDYIQIMEDLNIESTDKYRRSIWILFIVGIMQMGLSLFLDTFVINHYNFNGILVNIFNIVNLLISATLNLVYINKRNGRWDLMDIFNENLLLILDGAIQEKQLKFLTYSSSIMEQIIFWNFIFNTKDDGNININWRNFISNISTLEMEQQKLHNIKNIKNMNINVLCRIHLELSTILKSTNSINNSTNELWPFFYLHYNHTQKKLIISSHNSILYRQENKLNRKENMNGNYLMSIPTNLISIESIQSTVFPWILVYYNNKNQNITNVINNLIKLNIIKSSQTSSQTSSPPDLNVNKVIKKGQDKNFNNITSEYNNMDFKNQIKEYIIILENLLFSSENDSFTLNSLIQPAEINKKNQKASFQISKEFENKLSHIFNNYNFISFCNNTVSNNNDNNNNIGGKVISKESKFSRPSGNKILKLKDDPIYIMNCTIPAEYFLSMNVDIDCKDLVTRDKVVKLQIACFSFADLLNIYTVISS